MQFKKSFNIVDTGYQRNTYYYIDNVRVSSDKYFLEKYTCEFKGMNYNTSYGYTKPNGRTVQVCYYD